MLAFAGNSMLSTCAYDSSAKFAKKAQPEMAQSAKLHAVNPVAMSFESFCFVRRWLDR
jgi:hypothetical protein